MYTTIMSLIPVPGTTTELAWRAFRFCLENISTPGLNRIKVNLPPKNVSKVLDLLEILVLCELTGPEMGRKEISRHVMEVQ